MINLSADPTHLQTEPSETVIQYHRDALLGMMQEWTSSHRFPPVLLLTGQPGIGKREVIHFLARWILCEKRESLTACGECFSCEQSKNGHQVNVIEILSDSGEEGGSLKIEQFRELKASIGLGTHGGQNKVILIPYVEGLTPQASNSLLKLLEEPPAGWIFLLTTHDTTLLLPTLVSRCQTFRLKPLKNEILTTLLAQHGVPSERQWICSKLAQGSLKRALVFAEDEVWEQRQLFMQFLRAPQRYLQPVMEWGSQNPQNFETLIDLLEHFNSDLIRWSASHELNPHEFNTEAWLNIDLAEALDEYASSMVKVMGSVSLARQFWMNQAERLAQLRIELMAPLNRKILIQDVLFPWLEVKNL